MKITKSELKQIIKEEALKFKKKLQLESELAEIESQLAEVEAGEMMELPDGMKKWKPEFEELSRDGGFPALKEEEDEMMAEEDEMMAEEDEMMAEEKTLEEMLAEIMSEEGDIEECDTMEEEVVSEEEEEEEEMPETPLHEETDANQIYESKNNKKSVLTEEQDRMKKLAGIIKE